MKKIIISAVLACISLCASFADENKGAVASDDSKFLERVEGVNLRILDDNIWDYSKDTLPPAWVKLGVDCRDDVRAPQFAGMVEKYNPDLLALQEYSAHMHERFYPLIEKQGFAICTAGKGEHWNNTPIFYKKDALDMVECHYVIFTPSAWSNHGSKSFTSAVFVHKATGRKVALISTHLWWKSDKAQAGSTYARTSQVYQIIAEATVIRKRYDCPIFVVGDMNCEESTMPIQAFIYADFQPCYKVATVYADKHNGHHECGPKGYSTVSHRKAQNRPDGAIDHCFIFNWRKKVDIKVFDCIMSAFTVPLTDHYPNLIDARILPEKK